jgi:type I restriction enzyme R subunit
LAACGWAVQDRAAMNLGASRGVAVREFPLNTGFADYVLFVDRRAIGAVEAKKQGTPLTGVEPQSEKYSAGLPPIPPAWRKPLPFLYESTGVETYFTNGLEPEARARPVFAFHRPETLAEWASGGRDQPGGDQPAGDQPIAPTLRARLRTLPPLHTGNLWSAQIEAISNLERSFAENRPRALIQMATGSGKTFTAVSFIYRLIKFGGARRVLFLVDRNNLGKQTLKEFQQYVTPDDGRKFTELYNVQHLQSNALDSVSRVTVTTIQRLYSMLSGEAEFDPANEERSLFEVGEVLDQQPPKEVRYNPKLPVEYFDFIVTDECHRSIYNLWRGVLEYFDAFIVGLTATPNKQTFGFFNKNLVMEYSRRRAVADNVNVEGHVYRIRTAITEGGGRVEAGFTVDKRDRLTRARRWEQLDEDLVYTANQLDRDVVAVDQIRTVLETFRDRLPEIMPGRSQVPKTLIFAKDDSHADDIVRLAREVFGKGNEFCQKITYRVTGVSKDDLIATFRNSFNPRLAVTVDMIATGTDIRPLEVLLFMRQVRSAGLFEQMLGRGTRVIQPTDLQAVTPDAKTKTHFVIVDAVGVTEHPKVDVGVLDRKRSTPLPKLLEAVALGARDEDTLTTLAARLSRMEKSLKEADRRELALILGWGEASADVGTAIPALPSADASPLRQLANQLLDATDPDRIAEVTGSADPNPAQLAAARESLLDLATRPFDNPLLREKLAGVHRRDEQTIDTVSVDRVISAGMDVTVTEKMKAMVESFQQYVRDNADAITALQIIFSRPRRRQALTLRQIEELAERLQSVDRGWTTDGLWLAYSQLHRDRVRGARMERTLTDLIALVRHAAQLDDTLTPYPEQVQARFEEWLRAEELNGRAFTPEQRAWLETIAGYIGLNASVEAQDFEYGELFNKGGRVAAARAFGPALDDVLVELNAALVV